MEYVTLVLAILAGVASVVAAASIAAAKAQDVTISVLNARLADKEKDAAAAKAAGELEKARLEKLVSSLKADLVAQEADSNANRDPDVVRRRLRGLLDTLSAP